jgi:hypothetical protein
MLLCNDSLMTNLLDFCRREAAWFSIELLLVSDAGF